MFDMVFDHFTLEEIAEGVWVALAQQGGRAISNAGIIDLGDRTLVFDMTLSPAAGSDLVRAAEELTGRAPLLAINSHWHADHVLGNQALPANAAIISTAKTRGLITERMPRMIAERRKSLPQQIAELEQQIQTEREFSRRQELIESLMFLRGAVEESATLQLRTPTVTFEGRIVLHGTNRHAELLTYGGGHTASDAFLWLPDDCIVFMGDLLFNGMGPWVGDGNPREWIEIIDRIAALDPACDVLVPGHGTVTSRDAFAEQQRYLAALVAALDELHERAAGMDEVDDVPLSDEFAGWEGADVWVRNLRALYTPRSFL